MCIKYLNDNTLSFFYVTRAEASFVNMMKCKLSYRMIDVKFNSYLFEWFKNRYGGTGSALNSFDILKYFDADQLQGAVNAQLDSPETWMTTFPLQTVRHDLYGQVDNTMPEFYTSDDALDLYYILQDDAFYSSHQRSAMMEVIDPILKRDTAKKLPKQTFCEFSQTERNQIIKVFKVLKNIGVHMVTLQVPDAWPVPAPRWNWTLSSSVVDTSLTGCST